MSSCVCFDVLSLFLCALISFYLSISSRYDAMRGEFGWRDGENSVGTEGGSRRATFDIDRSRVSYRKSQRESDASYYSRRDNSFSDETDDSLHGASFNGGHSRDQSFASNA